MKELEYWKNKLEQLKAQNQSNRKELADLKKGNKTLQKALRYRDELFHAIPDALMLIQGEKIIDVNNIVLGQMGYKPEEMIGREFLTFIHPTMKAFAGDLIKKRLSGKRVPDQFEIDFVEKNGGRFCCEVRIGKIRLNGRNAFLMLLSPVDERRKKEKEKIQSKKMDALTTMAAGLTRHFSRDLKVIIDNTGNMRDMAATENGPLKFGLNHIESAASRLLKTTRRLETFSKTNNHPSDVILFDLKKIVQEAIALTNPKLKSYEKTRGVKINLKKYLRSVSPIQGDPNAIREVIAQLIQNAVDAMPKGGDLYVTTEENASHAFIYIQDSGHGVTDPVKEKIFDPCFTANSRGHLGLGLSLAYAIIKRHHGEIDITSENGQGTITSIMIPRASKEQRPKPRPVKRKIKDAQILIIEDDDIIRELLSELLVSKGFKVDTADNGLEGLYKFKRKAFHVVIADAKTPGVGGQVLLKKMKKINHDLPFALITHYKSGNKTDPDKKPIADLVINKPIDMNRLVQQVSELLIVHG